MSWVWVKADSSDFAGNLPVPRSGHTAVNIDKSKVVIFGGFADKKFLDDIAVFDLENKLWFTPECTGSGTDGQVAPAPRAFHVAVAFDCHMFVYGGRSGSKRLNDFWVLDTDVWQWSELTGFGDLPSAREFAAASAIGNRKIVMYGGWDGKKWLSDVYILDTISLEWTELAVSGSAPPPRCGHTATMVERRLLVYGGRGGGGPIMGDLWALKGIIEEENEAPGWTQLKLPGQQPTPRCGHTVTSGGHYLLLFGGHGTGGWLSRYDIYYNNCTILDRVSVQWKRLPVANEPPPARAYHSMTSIGTRYLLFGGFDGKSTFGDLWWLVPEDDSVAKRLLLTRDNPPTNEALKGSGSSQAIVKETQIEDSPILELQKRLGVTVSSVYHLDIVDKANDKELLSLSSRCSGDTYSAGDQLASIQSLRERWKTASASSIQLRELGPLLRDYQRLVVSHQLKAYDTYNSPFTSTPRQEIHHFFHIRNASELRMKDIPKLLGEYRQLLAN